jgi:hypothetical protein
LGRESSYLLAGHNDRIYYGRLPNMEDLSMSIISQAHLLYQEISKENSNIEYLTVVVGDKDASHI